jgi:beta-glucosidase
MRDFRGGSRFVDHMNTLMTVWRAVPTTIGTIALASSLAARAVAAGAQAPPVQQRVSAAVTTRVDALLRRMTVEEKVGQMTQLTIQAVAGTHGTATTRQTLDSAKLENAIVKYGVGSLLNVWDVALTPAEWRDLASTVQRFAKRSRLQIPILYGIDAVHGQNYMTSATLFPQNIAMAATWDVGLARRAAQITSYETRAGGIYWNFAPVLDIGRQPLWSRFFETFGEDPYLAATLGAAIVEASQRDPRQSLDSLLGVAFARTGGGERFLVATGKHFLGYSLPLSGKDRTTAWIPERELREYVLPPFKAAVDAGVRTVMINSGDINGEPVHASKRILTGLLRGELGFTGIAVSDWEDIVKLQTQHRVAASYKDAVRLSINAGIDMSMVPYNLSFADTLLALVREGAVSMARIDEAVRRILIVKAELGLFDRAGADDEMLAHVGAPAFAAVSRDAAEQSVTLLKNENQTLPLARTAKLLVVGPGALSLPAQFGSWSYTWQGTDTAVYPRGAQTLLDAIKAQAGVEGVTYVAGSGFDAEMDIGAAVSAARSVDAIIVALAEFPSTETPGNTNDLALPIGQVRLARAMEATGKPVVVTLFHNRPRIVRDIVDGARAILTGYETGPFGGEAVAAALFGDVNPSGKLPFTWPRFSGSVEHYDRAEPVNGSGAYNPEWEFGFGLSYTTFTYSDLRIDRASVGLRDTVLVSVAVANTGARAGREVVQLYSRDLYASIDPATRRLRDFQKISLAPAERRTVTFRLPIQRLAFVGLEDRWVVEAGGFEIMVGGLRVPLTVH